MPRYKPDRTVHADWWDEDEHATFYGTPGATQSLQAAFHITASQEIGTPTAPEDIKRMLEHMAAALVELLVPEGWTLKDRHGERIPLLPEALAALPTEDIFYLSKEGFKADPNLKPQADGTVVYQPGGMITPKAAEEGLDATTFPVQPATVVASAGG